MTRTKIVLDVDTGTDDAVAIMCAALHPKIDLVAVTTVNGNVSLKHTTDNTLRVLDWIGKDQIPVYRGMSKQIARQGFPKNGREVKVHMDTLPLPEPKGHPQHLSAPQFLVDAFAADQEMTLVAVAPLSNLAAAIALDPNFPSTVAELVIMGGGVHSANMTATAEFNVWADPEAAAVVFAAGFNKITLVPLDATTAAPISEEECKHLAALDTPASKLASDLIQYRIDGHRRQGIETDSTPVHDALCIASLVDASVIGTEFLNVVVETQGEYTVGMTVVDNMHITDRPANCHVALRADQRKFFCFLKETLGTN